MQIQRCQYHQCGKKGHIVPVCKSCPAKPQDPPRIHHPLRKPKIQKRRPAGGARYTTTNFPDAAESAEMGLLAVGNTLPHPPITVEMELSGKPVELELDTGATVTPMTVQNFKTLFPDKQIQKLSVILKTYTGEPLKILGEATIQVRYQQQEPQDLPLATVEGRGPPLLGRNWLACFQLNWSSIKTVLSKEDQLLKLPI